MRLFSFNTTRVTSRLVTTCLCVTTLGCGASAHLSVNDGTGPKPVLPTPSTSLIPLINVVHARGWSDSTAPTPATGSTVAAFAKNLSHPRWLYVLPNGDVLVAESNAPPAKTHGIRAWFFKHYQKKAGGAVPSPNRVTLLRDDNHDGIAETRSVLIDSIQSPFGMALVGDDLYVASADAVLRYRYRTGTTHISDSAKIISSLPGGPINHHWTKSLIASPDGRHLYVGVGSNSNVAEAGMEVETDRAAIWEIDPSTGGHRIFASGLRNPVGMTWEPTTGALWVVVNERDELGSDLVPDYLTSVRDGGFYGWPYSYYGGHVDTRVKPQRPDLVSTAIVPDYALGPHTASLGLTWFADSTRQMSGVFVGQHGSWNRKPRSGYKVVFIPFRDGRPDGLPRDVLTGFVNDDGEAYGRPVGVAMDRTGALLVADDVGNTIWRVVKPMSTP